MEELFQIGIFEKKIITNKQIGKFSQNGINEYKTNIQEVLNFLKNNLQDEGKLLSSISSFVTKD